ncbi:MAG: flagellar basal body rod protein FlgB [Thiobacillus sp.]|nr:flagellar basal body rod protein FlgB [Thiobacillus sp.]
MLNRLDDMLNFNTQALRVREQRQQVLASNIANADTPNYKARDLDFKTAAAAEAGLLYRTPAQGSVDGNTVNIDAERAAFADNAVHYEFNLTRITQQIKTMMAAIQG